MEEVRYKLNRETNIGLFELDTAGSVNTMNNRFVADLAMAIQKANSDAVKGVFLTSRKEKSFMDGPDLKELMADPSPLTIKHTLLKAQETLEALAKSPFPVVAVLVGQTALGGGFEFLLWACDHIFATEGSRLGLPEVTVGLFPSAGGPETLKRAVGLESALDIILGGKVLPAEFYADSGLVTMTSKSEILAEAEQWIENNRGIINRNYDPARQDLETLSLNDQKTIIKKARNRYTICPQKPYFKAALDAIEDGLHLDFGEAVKNQVPYFTQLVADPHVKNKIDFFFSVNSRGSKLARVNRKDARPTKAVAIIGAGLMGRGIAQVCADSDMQVLLLDVDEATAQAGKERISKGLDALVKKGRWSPERRDQVMSKISATAEYEEIKRVPLVIETVFEDLDLKQKILKQVQAVNPDVIFASNTSNIPMEDVSAKSDRPDQVVGMHYFSPAPMTRLLEVVQGPKTSETALATAVASGRQQGKTCIIVGDGPGFYTSRTFMVFMTTGFCLVELGLDPWEVDRLALEAGFPQGPLHIYGTVGGNVAYHSHLIMHSRKPELFPVPATLIKMHEADYVGVGKPCFYKNGLDPDTSALQFVVRNKSLPTPDREEAKEMLLLAMVNQAFLCLDDGVLRDYFSMDIGAVLGIGFPDCLHGPARYVSQKGVKATERRLLAIHEKYGFEFFKPANEFERLIGCGVDRGLI